MKEYLKLIKFYENEYYDYIHDYKQMKEVVFCLK